MTTRALAVLAAAVAVLVAIATTLIWTLTRDTPPAAAPQPIPTAAAATPTPSYNPDAGDAAEQEGPGPAETQEDAWGPVVDTFARNFTNTAGGTSKWRQRLTGTTAKPNVTTEVAAQLTTVDLRNVPTGHYTGRSDPQERRLRRRRQSHLPGRLGPRPLPHHRRHQLADLRLRPVAAVIRLQQRLRHAARWGYPDIRPAELVRWPHVGASQMNRSAAASLTICSG